MVDRKRRKNVSWIAPLIMGLLSFSSVSSRPSFELYRTLDVVGLLVSGACFGMTFGFAIMARSQRRTTGRVEDIQQELDRMLADTAAASVGTGGAVSTSAVTVDRARLLQLHERLEALLPALNRR
jgi:hypothetical protein